MILPVLFREAIHEAGAAIWTLRGRGRTQLTRKDRRFVWGRGAEVTAVSAVLDTVFLLPHLGGAPRQLHRRVLVGHLRRVVCRDFRDTVPAALALGYFHYAVTAYVVVMQGP